MAGNSGLNRRMLYEVLSVEDKRQMEVPVFQRAYSWRNDNWEKFLNDIFLENFLFMGVIIGYGSGNTAYPKFTLIDGQQRLTTISLFLLAIYRCLENVCENKKENAYVLWEDEIRRRLVITDSEGKNMPRLMLSIQNNNKEDYEWLIDSVLIKDKNLEKPKYFGNRLMSYAFNFFCEYCSKEISDMETGKKLYAIIKNLTFIELEEDTSSNAFKLFDVLNSSGVPLSAMDIIKNTMFNELDKRKMDMESHNLLFSRMIDNLLNSTFQMRFLRQYYAAFKSEPKIKLEGVPKVTISNVIDVYEQLSSQDPVYLINDMKKKSEIYKYLICANTDNDYEDQYKNLFNLGVTPSYTLLLYCIEKSIFNADDYEKLLLMIRNFFIRRNLLDIPPTRELDILFMDIVATVDGKKPMPTENNGEILKIIHEKLFSREELGNDEFLRKKLQGDIYETNPGMTRYLLCLLEENLRNKDSRVDLWEKKSNRYLFTIEHIFPQKGWGPNKEWFKMLNVGSEDEALKKRDGICHKLGNLTLTTSNSNLQDYAFDVKKSAIKKDLTKKGVTPIGYDNGFKINEYIVQQEKWDETKIKGRTSILVDEVLNILRLTL